MTDPTIPWAFTPTSQPPEAPPYPGARYVQEGEVWRRAREGEEPHAIVRYVAPSSATP